MTAMESEDPRAEVEMKRAYDNTSRPATETANGMENAGDGSVGKQPEPVPVRTGRRVQLWLRTHQAWKHSG